MAYKIKSKKLKEKKVREVNQDSFEIKKGEILDYSGSWGSGLATFRIKRDDGRIVNVSCDNATTTRSLASAYGGIEEGHTFNVKNIKGKRIYWGMTDWGTMNYFVPEEEATAELEVAYEKQF